MRVASRFGRFFRAFDPSLCLCAKAPRCLALGFVLATGAASAQVQGTGANVLEDKGVIEQVSGQLLAIKCEKGDWHVTIGPETNVNVTGSAEPDYLRPGLNVKFSGEIDKKNNLQKELEAVEIFTPSGKGGIGIFESGAEDAKIVRAPDEGKTYEFRGKVAAFKPGELTLSVGARKIIAKTTPTLKVAVNSHDISLAQEGDSVSVSGWYGDQQKPNATNMTPGEAEATSVSITLAKPLVGGKKVRATPGKLGGRPTKSAAPVAPAEAPNPFIK